MPHPFDLVVDLFFLVLDLSFELLCEVSTLPIVAQIPWLIVAWINLLLALTLPYLLTLAYAL
jgi:hypothetical protein